MMNREHILSEIRRTAKENGGAPLGRDRFEEVTGIKYADWWAKHWVRWGDAVQEAGLSPNTFQDAFTDEAVIEKLIGLIRELGHFPITAELRIKKRKDRLFPNDKVFYAHFGLRDGIVKAVIEYCESHSGFGDVPALCGSIALTGDGESSAEDKSTEVVGFVYMMKHGRHYKIGKTNATGRREYELAIQLPEKLRTVHAIKTDDPAGIEEYWHKRFALKRGNGEWFDLDATDIRAFKRRKFM
jgi:hypothetical protein